jgi:hypothetical protein
MTDRAAEPCFPRARLRRGQLVVLNRLAIAILNDPFVDPVSSSATSPHLSPY